MINSFSFIVPGMPVGKERPRKGKHGFYTPKKTKDYEENIRLSAISALNRTQKQYSDFKWDKSGSYKIEIYLYYKDQPKRIPDLDNVAKCVLDALNKSIFDDDILVNKLLIRRDKGYPETYMLVYITHET